MRQSKSTLLGDGGPPVPVDSVLDSFPFFIKKKKERLREKCTVSNIEEIGWGRLSLENSCP